MCCSIRLPCSNMNKAVYNYRFLFLKVIFIYLCIWLCWTFVTVRGLPLVAESWGYSLLHGLLIVVVSLVAEHRLWGHRLQQLWCMGLVAPQLEGSSWTRDQTLMSPSTLAGRFLTTATLGKSSLNSKGWKFLIINSAQCQKLMLEWGMRFVTTPWAFIFGTWR